MIDSPRLELRPKSNDHITIDLAYRLLDSTHGQVRIADEKVRALFGATTLLAAAVAFSVQPGSTLVFNPLTPVDWVVLATRSLLFLAIAYSVAAAILALLPRVEIKSRQRSLFFFGDVAPTRHDDFLSEFINLPEPEAVRQILSQVHANSQIVLAKYRWTGRAANGFLVAVVVWLMLQIMLVLI